MKKKDIKDIDIINSAPVKGVKKFFADFKAFIQKGNVLNLAVGVIIGAAFTAIVNSFTKDIFMPLITALFAVCGVQGGLSGMSIVLNGVEPFVLDSATNTMVTNPEAILWNYGTFIQAVIDFLLTAFVVFCIVKILTAATDAAKKAKAHISDKIEYLIEGEDEAEEAPAAEETPAPAPEPTPDPNAEMVALLKDIKALLEKQASSETKQNK